MELVGTAVEERDLTGDENLGDLVNKFLDTKALPKKGEMMPSIDWHFRQEFSKRKVNARKTLISLTTNPCLPCEKKQREEAIEESIGEYFRASFGAYYDRLSNDLFDLERREEFVFSLPGKIVKINIPLFASVSIIYPNNGLWSYRKEIVLKNKVGIYDRIEEVKHEIIVSSHFGVTI